MAACRTPFLRIARFWKRVCGVEDYECTQPSFNSRRICHVHVTIAPRRWSVPFACESWMSQIQTKSHDPMGIGANRRRHKLFPGSTDGNGQGNVRNWAAIGAISTSTSTVPNSASAGNALVLVDGARFVKLMQEPVDSVEHARAQALCAESRPFHHPSFACSSSFPSTRCPHSLVATHEIRPCPSIAKCAVEILRPVISYVTLTSGSQFTNRRNACDNVQHAWSHRIGGTGSRTWRTSHEKEVEGEEGRT